VTVSKERMTFDPHDPEATAAFVERRLTPGEHALVQSHAADCAECREIIAALVRVTTEQAVPGGGTLARPSSFPVRRYLLPIAATLALGTIAMTMVLRLDRQAASEGPAVIQTPPAPTPGASAGPEVTPQPSAPPPVVDTPQPAVPADDLLRRRSGERTVDGKRFRLTAGEWIDAAFDPLLALPVVEASSPAERKALLDRVPALRPFAELGPRLTVVHDGTVYRIH
jgi:hypothetical protein